MSHIEIEFQSAISTARHALEQFNAEPLVARRSGAVRWRVWVQASEVAQRGRADSGSSRSPKTVSIDDEIDRLLREE